MGFQLILAFNLLSWQHRKLQTLALGPLDSCLLFGIAPGNGRGKRELASCVSQGGNPPSRVVLQATCQNRRGSYRAKATGEVFQLLLRFRT